MRPNTDFAFLLKVADGVLEHKNSVFDFQNDTLRVLSYSDGKFMGEEKSIARNAERCHKEIVMSLFGKEQGAVKFLSDLTQRIKTMPGNFLGSFILDEKTWYFGGWSDGKPNGLGVLIEAGLRVQIGYFEEGQLTSFGRCISKAGVVMDGTMKRSTMNDEVILYNQSAHDYVQAIFKDNLLEEEIGEGHGFPREERQQLFNQRFMQSCDRKFKIEILPTILCPDVDQEEVFSVVMGFPFNPNGLNNFKFRLSGSKWIDTESRKDQEDHKQHVNVTSRDSDPTPPLVKVPPVPLEILHKGTNQGGIAPARNMNDHDGGRNKDNPSLQPQGKELRNVPPQTTEFQTYGRSSDDEAGGHPNRSEKDRAKQAESGEWDELQGYGDEPEGFTLRNDKEHPFDPRREPAPHFGQPHGYLEDAGDADHYHRPEPNRPPHLSHNQVPSQPQPPKNNQSAQSSSQFDKYDMLILQRSLNWETEKVLNPKNRFSRKTLTTAGGSKGVSEETRLNIIQNYIEDFMFNFLDKKTIDQLMSGVEGYSTIRNRVLQHGGGPSQH